MVLHLPALVVLATVLMLFLDAWRVGRARTRHGVRAPATSGPPEFERTFRAQANNLESAVMFLPALWLFGHYVHPLLAGVLGFVWIATRLWYFSAYAAGARRGPPFVASAIVLAVLVVGALVFVVRAMLLTGG